MTHASTGSPHKDDAHDGPALLDAVIVGGGPAGLAAALALGRARRAVVLADAGPRRNAAARALQNFVTRDGTPPEAFRAAARAELAAYPTVALRDEGVRAIDGERDAFVVTLASGATLRTRRVVLATGMVDAMLPIEGFDGAWGHGIVQCPYCHGFEHRGGRWAYLAPSAERVPFAAMLRAFTDDVTLLASPALALPEGTTTALAARGVRVETHALVRIERLPDRSADPAAPTLALTLEAPDGARHVEHVALLFAHPPQHQTPLVQSLSQSRALALDEQGFVRVDPRTRETSIPGIHAAGDLCSPMQAAIAGAAAGTHAGAAVVHALFELPA